MLDAQTFQLRERKNGSIAIEPFDSVLSTELLDKCIYYPEQQEIDLTRCSLGADNNISTLIAEYKDTQDKVYFYAFGSFGMAEKQYCYPLGFTFEETLDLIAELVKEKEKEFKKEHIDLEEIKDSLDNNLDECEFDEMEK